MENEENKRGRKSEHKGDTMVTSYRANKNTYGKFKTPMRKDIKEIIKKYEKLDKEGIQPEEIENGILHKYGNNNDLIKKLVLLMIRAKINSDEYDIEITEEEIQPIIKKLSEDDLFG